MLFECKMKKWVMCYLAMYRIRTAEQPHNMNNTRHHSRKHSTTAHTCKLRIYVKHVDTVGTQVACNKI